MDFSFLFPFRDHCSLLLIVQCLKLLFQTFGPVKKKMSKAGSKFGSSYLFMAESGSPGSHISITDGLFYPEQVC